MRKIIAIGGGDIAKKETLSIDREVVKMSGKDKPKVLFIPTASNDDRSYCEAFDAVYNKELGCETDHLFLLDEELSYEEIAEKILSADIIYAGNGNSLMMMRKWRFTGVDKLLAKALDRGTVLAGIGSGAACWFEYGHSDSMKYYKTNGHSHEWDFIRVKCLRFVDRFVLCPHYELQHRSPSFQQMIKKMGNVGIGLGEHCAIQIVDDKYRLITTNKTAKAHKVYKTRTSTVETEINFNDDWQPLGFLRSRG